MKIQNILLKIKLKQIETKYKYIFLFHCSNLNASQWRHLKQILHLFQGSTLYQPSGFAKMKVVEPKHDKLPSDYILQTKRAQTAPKRNRSAICTPNQSNKTHQNVLQSKAALGSFSTLPTISGPFCVVYCSHENLDQSADNFWSELLNKLNYLENNANFMLLYAQFNSNTINHIDVKHAMNLTKHSTFQQFLEFVNYPSQSFENCLNSNASGFAGLCFALMNMRNINIVE